MKLVFFAVVFCLIGQISPLFATKCVNQLPESDCQGLKSSGRCALSKVKELCPAQCAAECSKKPSGGSSSSVPTCRNDLPNAVCEALSLTGRCVYKDIRTLCPEQCGVCNGTISLDKNTSPFPTRHPTQECKDDLPGFICTDLNLQGKCYMCAVQTICPQKCGACAGTKSTCLTSDITPPTTGSECVDKSSSLCKAMAGVCDLDPMVAASCRATCGTCPTTTIATTTVATTTVPTTTPKPKPTGPPRKCQQCGKLGGAPCTSFDLLLGKPKDCPSGEQYCIVDVKIEGGKRNIFKRCANFQTCYRDWYELSSDKDYCVNFDPQDTSVTSLDCSFCCTKDGCNKKYKPDVETLFDALN